MNTESNPILLGCSSWTYPDWNGPFYPEGLNDAERLASYADRFPIVEVDSTFYGTPNLRTVKGWHDRTPASFRFSLKVPKVITHAKKLRGCRADVDAFASALEPLGDKLFCALLQMGYFNQRDFATLGDFLAVLDAFLADWPHKAVPLAVETRNPRWVTEDFMAVLKAHGASFALTDQKWMPTPTQVFETLDPVTGPVGLIRLLGDREGIEKITTRWDKVVIDRSKELAETADVAKRLARVVPVAIFASNRYAGYAPETAATLRGLLGLPEPPPIERPRVTLFD